MHIVKKYLFLSLQVANSGGLTETEKKEKKALEKKLCEMEEELKVSYCTGLWYRVRSLLNKGY